MDILEKESRASRVLAQEMEHLLRHPPIMCDICNKQAGANCDAPVTSSFLLLLVRHLLLLAMHLLLVASRHVVKFRGLQAVHQRCWNYPSGCQLFVKIVRVFSGRLFVYSVLWSHCAQVAASSKVWTCENGRRTVLHSVAYDVCQAQDQWFLFKKQFAADVCQNIYVIEDK